MRAQKVEGSAMIPCIMYHRFDVVGMYHRGCILHTYKHILHFTLYDKNILPVRRTQNVFGQYELPGTVALPVASLCFPDEHEIVSCDIEG